MGQARAELNSGVNVRASIFPTFFIKEKHCHPERAFKICCAAFAQQQIGRWSNGPAFRPFRPGCLSIHLRRISPTNHAATASHSCTMLLYQGMASAMPPTAQKIRLEPHPP
jgi:hypothetical protein